VFIINQEPHTQNKHLVIKFQISAEEEVKKQFQRAKPNFIKKTSIKIFDKRFVSGHFDLNRTN